jgi:predicted transcriptional regulator
MISLDQIRNVRRKLGITQQQLAHEAGVSQSLVTKIENGLLDPSFSHAQKRLSALGRLSQTQSQCARDVMSSRVIAVHPDDDLRKTIRRMRHYDIDQMPVVEDAVCIGRINDSLLLDALASGETSASVREIMGSAPPSVAPDTPLDSIVPLLKHYQFVLVLDKGKIKGIVSKFDVIENLRRM